MLYLVEHFYSIQGEGKFTGVPSVFFRFGGCNMKCEGFACEEILEDGTTILGCDTIYAVNREHFQHNWKQIESSNQLLHIVDSYNLPPLTKEGRQLVDIVLTGGEPLLYANDKIFIEFLETLHQRGHRICFETNGSLAVDFKKYPIYKECIFALSVKLSNSNEPLKKRINPDIISSLTLNAKDAFFKFSIGAGSISKLLEDEIKSVTKHSPTTDVYCMPLGGSKKEIEDNSEPLVEFCKKTGYNFSDRLHMRIWDKKKGI